MNGRTLKLLLCFVFLISIVAATTARSNQVEAAAVDSIEVVKNGRVYNETAGETESAYYIIQLSDEPVATYTGGIAGLAATSPVATGARKLDVNSPESLAYEQYLADTQDQFVSAMNILLGRSVDISFYYRHAYNGVAAFLSPAEAARVAQMDGVLLLYRESEEELLTDAGPEFLGAPTIWGGSYTNRQYHATIDGSQEVPPTPSTATGEGAFTYNLLTNELTWHISHDLDMGDVTAAHIHSGAAGTNGPVEVPLDHTVNPMIGSATLTDAQQGMLVNGLLYVNIHTAAFPGGEIRGQIYATGTMGEGIIIGVIDTGINSSHPSFAEVGGDGYVHTNPNGSGNYVGYCVANPSFCNDKLIGAWAFHPSSTNPEDANGHGSHTAGTAGGNFLQEPVLYAPTQTYTFTAVSGVAPHANIIAYQVCVPSCPTTSTTAAVNQAVIDGVDVTNYSISGGANPYVETTAVAFRNAAVAGVFPANSAGNSGPGAGTVGHQGPWIMTVGASTHNRAILNSAVELTSSEGSHPDIMGQSPTAGYGPATLVYAGDPPYNNPLCQPFGGVVFSGEIVVCDRGAIGRVLKGQHVLAAGGGGMILLNDAPSAGSLNDDTHVLPATHVSYADGLSLKAWMATGTNHMGRITGGTIDYDDAYGDKMASFSSRGPAGSSVPGLANLIKPDVTAPGLNILAAYFAGFTPPPSFNIISGTSMSSPHAAGAAALVRAMHPSWTPAEVKSALMMTGLTAVDKEDGMTSGDPFDFGGGRVNLTQAGSVGFVLDITEAEYLAANPAIGGDPRLLNLPSMASVDCPDVCSWTRTLRSVLDTEQEYDASVLSGSGVTGTVTPSNFTIPAGGTQEITIELNVTGATMGTWTFAELLIEPASALAGGPVPTAKMPISAVRTQPQPSIEVGPSSLESVQVAGTTTTHTLTITNTGTGLLDWTIFEDPGTTSLAGFWTEDFDSYATGQNMHGVGGWKGWDNLPGFTAFTSDAQARSTPNSFAIEGGNDPVREFSGVNSGQWTFTTWQYIPTGMTGTSYFIMLNTYNDGGAKNWSVQVRFNSATGVTNDGVSGGNLPLITNQWVEIRLEIDLDADTQTFYYNNQQLYTGSWTGQVSGGGVLNIGAVNLFANGASVVYYDDMSLTTGPAPACAAPGDIPWASVDPDSGTTGPGDSSDVTVTLDATGLAAGTYEGSLCVSSNDSSTPLVVVPVTLEVEAVVAGVEVAAEEAELSGEPGSSVSYTVWITNTGNAADTFDLAISDNEWDAMPSTASVMLGSGESTSVMVTVDIPAGTDDGEMDMATFSATSQADDTVSDSVVLTTTAVVSTYHLYLPIIMAE
jgi:subtilisin family serine protease